MEGYCEWNNNPDEPSGVCITIDGDFIDKIICSEFKYKEECNESAQPGACSWKGYDTNENTNENTNTNSTR